MSHVCCHHCPQRFELFPWPRDSKTRLGLAVLVWNFNTLPVWKVMNLGYKVMNLGYKALHFGWCRQTPEPGVPRGISACSSWPSSIKILITSYLSPTKSSKLLISTYVWDYFIHFTCPQSINWQRLPECKALLMLSFLCVKRTLSGRKLIFPAEYTTNILMCWATAQFKK